MKQPDPRILLRDTFKPIVKSEKAKSTYISIYKKQGDYFWYIKYDDDCNSTMSFDMRIKLWMYDELLFSIVYPNKDIHYTDLLRLEGFHAMRSYLIDEKEYMLPFNTSVYDLYSMDSGVLSEWCTEIFRKCYKTIADFIADTEEKYGDLNGFHINNAENDLLTAAFAHVARKEYEPALHLLHKARDRGKRFGRSYGSIHRDLLDVLIDYCRAQLNGVSWTRHMVVG